MRIQHFLFTAALTLFAVTANAQLDVVRFTVQDGISDATLKADIEKSTSTLLSALNLSVISLSIYKLTK